MRSCFERQACAGFCGFGEQPQERTHQRSEMVDRSAEPSQQFMPSGESGDIWQRCGIRMTTAA